MLLFVVVDPCPVWLFTVCDAVTVMVPSGRPLTLTPDTDQLPPVQVADAGMPPMLIVTGCPSAEQAPDTP
ncbi:hypothetical protein D3C72_2137210 [compost metagenome]